jgi:dipeptidyl aminopeptidase/acylaminoacyl peptidase
VLLQARDGVTLPSYLTLPPLANAPKALLPPNPNTSSPEAQGWGSVSGLRLPLVLFVHGGPWARDVWGLDSTAQWFANRGYAVLQVRGSCSGAVQNAILCICMRCGLSLTACGLLQEQLQPMHVNH